MTKAENVHGTLPRRVTILTAHFAPEHTGNAPYTTDLARGLAARGYEVHVLTAHPFYPEWRVQPGYGGWTRHEMRDGVHVQRMSHYVPRSPGPIRRMLSELTLGLRFLAGNWQNPDVVILVSPALFSCLPSLLRTKRLSNAGTTAWVQDLYGLGVIETGVAGPRIGAAIKLLETRLFKSLDGIVVIHDRFRDVAIQSYDIPPHRIKVIRNWSHLTDISVGDVSNVRARFGWQPTDTVVLHAGNMGAKQGLENVVNAAREADRRESPVKFVLLGSGSDYARLRTLARGIRKIQFIDPVPAEEFLSVLRAADILLVNELPALREMSVPSKLTSYFASGRPVLAATDADSVTAGEVRASGAGMRIDPGSPGGLVDAAMALRADPPIALAFGEAGARYRSAVLTREAALDSFEDWVRLIADCET